MRSSRPFLPPLSARPAKPAVLWLAALGAVLAAPSPQGALAARAPGAHDAPVGPDLAALRALGARLAARQEAQRTPLYERLRRATEGPQGRLNAEPGLRLVGVDARGRPVFFETHNLNAAKTVQVDRLWPGGASGLELTGANLPGELGLWDGGGVLTTHQEFGGRVAQMDAPSGTNFHATHVAGTMVAAGVNANAKGMSPAAWLQAWEWTNDETEMALAAAAGLLVSNHSYGYLAGWYRDGSGVYYWFGDIEISSDEDPGFGHYGEDVRWWDEIAAAAPNYLIVMSAGNDRDDTGPPVGSIHYYWEPTTSQWTASTATRDPDGGDTGYDTLPYRSAAKNPLVVGAVADLLSGWTAAETVSMAVFSSWGPTDDGRIKPDLVANGISLLSTVNTGDANYGSYSGTSMAAPSAAGALHLVAQQWKAAHDGAAPRAATLKAIAVHTADEAGPAAGPDYMFGWGLLNARAAAQLAAADTLERCVVRELTLASGAADTFHVLSDGSTALIATLAWTDLPGAAVPWSLDPPDLALVHDLDLRLECVASGQVTWPWTLDPSRPSAAAARGDNDRDNVEKLELASPDSGLYRLVVSHEGSLVAPQPYSLAVSGLVASPATAPVVSGLTFAQRRDGSGLVDVVYDLADPDSPTVSITLEVSRDDGRTWDVPVVSVSGDVGSGVPPGLGKTIVWDLGVDLPDAFGTAFRVRVRAED